MLVLIAILAKIMASQRSVKRWTSYSIVVVLPFIFNLEQDTMFRLSPSVKSTEIRIIRSHPMRNGNLPFWLRAAEEQLGIPIWTSGIFWTS